MFQNYPEYAREVAQAFKHAPRNTKIRYYRRFVAFGAAVILAIAAFQVAGIAKAETLKQESLAVLASQGLSPDNVTVSNELVDDKTIRADAADDVRAAFTGQLNDRLQWAELDKNAVKVVDDNTTQVTIEMESGAVATVTLEKGDGGELSVTKADVAVTPQIQTDSADDGELKEKQVADEDIETAKSEFKRNIAKLDVSDICKALDVKQNDDGSYALDSDDAKDIAGKRIVALSGNMMALIPSGYTLQDVPEASDKPADDEKASDGSEGQGKQDGEPSESASAKTDGEFEKPAIDSTEIYQNELGDTITVKISSLNMNTSKKTGQDVAEVLMGAWVEATDSIISTSSQQYANDASKYEKEIFYLEDCGLWGYRASTKSHDDTRNITHIRFGFVDMENGVAVTVTYRGDRQIKQAADSAQKAPAMSPDEFNKLFSQAPDKSSVFGEVFQSELADTYHDMYKKDDEKASASASRSSETAFQTAI